jgi:hypothetical protein
VGLQESADGTVGDVRKLNVQNVRVNGILRPLRGLRYSLGYQLRLHCARMMGLGI